MLFFVNSTTLCCRWRDVCHAPRESFALPCLLRCGFPGRHLETRNRKPSCWSVPGLGDGSNHILNGARVAIVARATSVLGVHNALSHPAGRG